MAVCPRAHGSRGHLDSKPGPPAPKPARSPVSTPDPRPCAVSMTGGPRRGSALLGGRALLSPTMAAETGAGRAPRGEGRTVGGARWGARSGSGPASLWSPGTRSPLTPCLGYEAEAKFQAESIASTRTPHPAPNTPQYNTEPWDGQSDYRGPDGRLLAKMKRSGKIPEKQPQATTWHFIPSQGVIREGTAETNCAWRHRLSVSAQTSEKTADSEHPSRAATGRGGTEPPAAWGFWWLEAGCCRNKTKFVTSRSRQQAETYGPHKNEWLGPNGKE